jgi:hypothetical protein
MHQYRIRLAPSLVESMTLATMEAFEFRGAGSNKKSGVETYGYVWGTKKSYADGITVFYLDKLSVSISAKRFALSFFPNPRAGLQKRDPLKRMAPHQTLLADFHSHPYATPKIMKRPAGFEFSKADFERFLDDDFFWESAENTPVMLVQTICRLHRRRTQSSGWIRSNVFYFDIDEHRFWINASVGYVNSKGNRSHTGNLTRSVAIELSQFR